MERKLHPGVFRAGELVRYGAVAAVLAIPLEMDGGAFLISVEQIFYANKRMGISQLSFFFSGKFK